MTKLEDELEQLVHSIGYGGGFGSQDALEQHEREIELLKFKISRRDNMKIAIVSALIGSIVAAIITFLSQMVS